MKVGLTQIARFVRSSGETSADFQIITDANRAFRRNKPSLSSSPWELEYVFPPVGTTEQIQSGLWKSIAVSEFESGIGKLESCLEVLHQNSAGRLSRCWYAPGHGLVRRFTESSGIEEVLVEHETPLTAKLSKPKSR